MPDQAKLGGGEAAPQQPVLDPAALDPTEDVVEPAPGPRRGRGEAGLTPDGRLKSGRLAGLSMHRAIWVLSWPVLVDSLLNTFVGLTDQVLASGMSEAASDAVGMASYCMWFMGLVVMALDIGATALVSRSVGAGRLAVANAAVGQTVLLALIAGLLLSVIVGAAATPLGLAVFGRGEAAEAFGGYMFVIALAAPLMALLFGGIACARGAGDTFTPMTTMVAVNVVNIFSAWALSGVDLKTASVVNGHAVTRVLIENPFPFDLGVTGIALGTLLGYAVGAVVILGALGRGGSGVRLRRQRLRPHWHTMRRIARVGVPNFAETLGMWAGNFLVVLMVGWLGAGMVGAHSVTIRIEAFSFQPGFAISLAAAALAGQYLGAGSPRLARRSVLTCTIAASVIMGLMGVAFITMPRTLVGLLTSQPTHLSETPRLLVVTGIVQVPFAIGIVLRTALRGVGDVKVVMWITWFCTYAVRLPAAYLLSGVDVPLPGGGVLENPFPYEWGLTGLWIGLCVEVIVRGALFTARFWHGGWARLRV